jgi:hypothetical protein
VTTAPVPAELQHWAEAFRRGNHYDAVYDRAAALALRARNRTMTIVLAAIGAVSLLLCLVLVVFGGGFTRLLIVLGIFGLVAMLVSLPTIVSVGTRLRRLDAGEGVFARVSNDGVSFGLVGPIRWSEMVGVIAFDASGRAETSARIPLIGWGARLAQRAGNGSRGLTIALRDGTAVQARIRDERERGFVRLWGQRADAVRPGDISIILDPLLDEPGVRSLTEATIVGATLNGVPVYHPRSTPEYLQTLGSLVDPKWSPSAS